MCRCTGAQHETRIGAYALFSTAAPSLDAINRPPTPRPPPPMTLQNLSVTLLLRSSPHLLSRPCIHTPLASAPYRPLDATIVSLLSFFSSSPSPFSSPRGAWRSVSMPDSTPQSPVLLFFPFPLCPSATSPVSRLLFAPFSDAALIGCLSQALSRTHATRCTGACTRFFVPTRLLPPPSPRSFPSRPRALFLLFPPSHFPKAPMGGASRALARARLACAYDSSPLDARVAAGCRRVPPPPTLPT